MGLCRGMSITRQNYLVNISDEEWSKWPSLGARTQPAYQILKLAVCAENVDLDQDEQDDAAPEVGPQNIAGPVRARPHPLEARQNDEREAGPLHPSPYPRIGY